MIELQLHELLTHIICNYRSTCTCEQLNFNNVPHNAHFTFIFSASLTQAIHSVGWHHEGKQFMCSHSDGSLTMWNLRNTTKPIQITFPHGEDLKSFQNIAAKDTDLIRRIEKQKIRTKCNFLFRSMRFLKNGFSSCNAVHTSPDSSCLWFAYLPLLAVLSDLMKAVMICGPPY